MLSDVDLAMPRRSGGPSADDREYIYAPSSSSEEDWGDGSWEVDGIIGEHIDTRGERRYVVTPLLRFVLLNGSFRYQVSAEILTGILSYFCHPKCAITIMSLISWIRLLGVGGQDRMEQIGLGRKKTEPQCGIYPEC